MENNEAVRLKLHKTLMKIALEIKRICDKNEISYFLIAGSLLGAVRHQGIIPWDDDVDIGMVREEYNRFEQACNSDLGPEFFMSSIYTENKYGKSYIKIRLKGTLFPETGRPEGLNDGIFVDVFPIDRIPIRAISRKVQHFKQRLFQFTLLVKCGYQIEHVVYLPYAKVLASFLSVPFLYKQLVKTNSKHNNNRSLDYASLTGAYFYGQEILPKECIDDGLTTLPFEGVEFNVPKYPEKVLTCLYGDFMKLPPPEKRVFRHVVGEIDFGKYDQL